MSYVRLFEVVQDFALGIQSVNHARDNNAALLGQLDLRHEIGGIHYSESGPLKAFGRHDDTLIARGVTTVHISTDTGAPSPFFEVSGPLFQGVPSRRRAGVWAFSLRGAWIFGAVATPLATSAVDFGATAVTAGSTLYVTTWSISGTDFALADLDFSVAVWGRP